MNSERSAPPRPGSGAGPVQGRVSPRRDLCRHCHVKPPLPSPPAQPNARPARPRGTGPELHAGRGQLHERLFQRGLGGRQLVQPDRLVVGQVADLLGGQPLHHDRAVGAVQGPAARQRDRAGQRLPLRGADPHRLHRVARDELGHRAVGDQLAAADHQQVVGGVLHLGHQVGGHEDGAAFRGQRLHQVPDPQDAFRVQPVDRLVEHQDGRVAEQRGGDAEALPHAQGEPLRPLPGHLAQPDQFEHLAHPAGGQVVRLGQAEQVVVRAPAAVHGLGVEQRTDFAHRVGEPAELLAVHGDPAVRREVEPEDEPHRGGLARSVGAEEAGDPARLHGEREVVHRHLVPVAFGEAPCLNH